jgi:hypothetical protein
LDETYESRNMTKHYVFFSPYHFGRSYNLKHAKVPPVKNF